MEIGRDGEGEADREQKGRVGERVVARSEKGRDRAEGSEEGERVFEAAGAGGGKCKIASQERDRVEVLHIKINISFRAYVENIETWILFVPDELGLVLICRK